MKRAAEAFVRDPAMLDRPSVMDMLPDVQRSFEKAVNVTVGGCVVRMFGAPLCTVLSSLLPSSVLLLSCSPLLLSSRNPWLEFGSSDTCNTPLIPIPPIWKPHGQRVPLRTLYGKCEQRVSQMSARVRS